MRQAPDGLVPPDGLVRWWLQSHPRGQRASWLPRQPLQPPPSWRTPAQAVVSPGLPFLPDEPTRPQDRSDRPPRLPPRRCKPAHQRLGPGGLAPPRQLPSRGQRASRLRRQPLQPPLGPRRRRTPLPPSWRTPAQAVVSPGLPFLPDEPTRPQDRSDRPPRLPPRRCKPAHQRLGPGGLAPPRQLPSRGQRASRLRRQPLQPPLGPRRRPGPRRPDETPNTASSGAPAYQSGKGLPLAQTHQPVGSVPGVPAGIRGLP